MNDAKTIARKWSRPEIRHVLIICAAIVGCSVLATWRSYARSDSLTFIDATVCTDEGLLSLQIPLVPLAPSEEPSTKWTTYKRGKNMWEAEGGGRVKATLRNWMSMLDAKVVRCEGEMLAGFGYWKGTRQSKSRPGPFVVMFVPVWFAIATTFVAIAIACWLRVQFTLATMLLGTTFAGCTLWLLSLRAVG